MSKKQEQVVLKVRKGIALQASLLALALVLGANLWFQPSSIGMTVPDSPEATKMVVPDSPEVVPDGPEIVPDGPEIVLDASDPEW